MTRDSKEDVLGDVFRDFEDNIGDKGYLKSRLMLAADNDIVNRANNELVERLPGKTHTFLSVDMAVDDEAGTTYLNTADDPSSLPQHELRLKVNAAVMLMCNFNVKAGHCNGTRYIIKSITAHRLVLEKLDGIEGDTNNILLFPIISNISSERLQFPIKLAFAATFNISQGQSFEGKLGVILPKKAWHNARTRYKYFKC